jgi:hypothetical protein
MSRKHILPLASALAALLGSSVVGTQPVEAATPPSTGPEQKAGSPNLTANTLISTGESLLGFLVTEQADGTIVAQHVSHASHSSHASHASHHSSR